MKDPGHEQSQDGARLKQKIRDRSAQLGVMGLGYVGLPLALEMATEGFQVTGIDIDAKKVEAVNAGHSYVLDVPSADMRKLVTEERLRATQSLVAIEALDTVSICVPTPLSKTKDPDVRSDPETVFNDFERQFIDTRLFFERYIGNSEWPYFQAAHETGGVARDRDEARRRVEEAQLFIEASHACFMRLCQAQGGGSPVLPWALATPT